MRTAKEIADHIHARLIGDGTIELSGVASVESAKPGALVFVDNEKWLQAAMESKASAVIAGEFAGGLDHPAKPLLIVRQPKLGFVRATALLVPRRSHVAGVHSTAVLHHSVKLGKKVAIQPHAVLTEGVEVGDHTRIGPGAAVGANARIGSHCNIAANVTIYPNTTIGNRVVIHAGAVLGADGFGFVRDEETGRYEAFPQIGTLVIEDDVEIGANSTIDRGALGRTIIRRGTKIDNLVHIGHNADIGEDVVMAAQTGVSGSVLVEKNVIVGGQVGLADHVRIEEGAILGAQTGVPSNKVIRGKGVVFWGTPARPLREYLRQLAVLARLAKNG